MKVRSVAMLPASAVHPPPSALFGLLTPHAAASCRLHQIAGGCVNTMFKDAFIVSMLNHCAQHEYSLQPS
jgi:hypothetical protein